MSCVVGFGFHAEKQHTEKNVDGYMNTVRSDGVVKNFRDEAAHL